MGGWLVKRLLEVGAEVIALVRDKLPSSLLASEGLEDQVTVVRGDLCEFSQMRRIIAEYEVHTVFHLAAQPIVAVAKRDPLSTLETNIRGTWNVLEACRQPHVKAVVVASSDKAYGTSDVLPYDETHPLRGRFPYDVSKSCADLIAQMYATSFQLPIAVLRCANLFGGGDLNFNRIIPGAIRAAARNERFQIRSDGYYVRDYLYVEDAADGYLTVAQKLIENPSLRGEAYNLSVGLRLSVIDLTRKILAMMDRSELEPIILNQPSDEIRDQYLSASKIKAELGWTPRYTLEQGLEKTIAWYLRRFESSGNEAYRELSVGARG
jgi:CDP-glucose 4,6-dehydratase